jgi:hypothetical protein
MENIGGAPISDLVGYHMYYGDSRNALMHLIQLRNPAMTATPLRNPPRGVHISACQP